MSWQTPNRLDEVVRPDPPISGLLGWNNLEKGTGIEPDHLNLRSWVSVPVTLSKKLQDLNPDLRSRGDSVPDRDGLERLWPLRPFPSQEERAKLRPDGARLTDG